MTTLDARGRDFKELNRLIRACADPDLTVTNCGGQRYIGNGLSGRRITVEGVPGNGLGAYMDGAELTVMGNAQDATGDTMNDGRIVIHGSSGDATGYAMRGGGIYVRDNAGYRAGIHMKAYEDKLPELVIGGRAGSFLGEYQAGGLIIVLGLREPGRSVVGNFCGAGMHGGRIYLRCAQPPARMSHQVVCVPAKPRDMDAVAGPLAAFCRFFGEDMDALLDHPFFLLTPDTANPYKQLYTYN